MLEDIVSETFLEAFRVAYTMDYIDLFQNFEKKKWEHQSRKPVSITVPASSPEIVDNIDEHIEDQESFFVAK